MKKLKITATALLCLFIAGYTNMAAPDDIYIDEVQMESSEEDFTDEIFEENFTDESNSDDDESVYDFGFEEIIYPDMYETASDYETLSLRFLWSSGRRTLQLISEVSASEETFTQETMDAASSICGEDNVTIDEVVNYYLKVYQIAVPNESIMYGIFGNEYYIDGETVEERSDAVKYVIDYYGLINNVSSKTIIKTLCQRVQASMEYDEDASYSSLIEAVESGKGVCVHYAACAYILLNAQGIPTRLVSGTLAGGSHLWCECYVDNEWIMVDFTPGTYSEDGIVTYFDLYSADT